MSKSKKTRDTANILGFSFFSKQRDDLLRKIKIHLSSKNQLLKIFTPNAEQLVQAQQNPNFNRYLAQADLLIADGMSLVWYSRLFAWRGKTQALAERIAGVDLVQDLLKLSQEEGRRILLIGGQDYQHFRLESDHSSQPLKKQLGKSNAQNCWQLSQQLWWTPGYQQISQPTLQEEQQLKQLIHTLKPELALVAFGAPYQEKWIMEHQQWLQQEQVRLAMAVGGAFDIIFGRLRRAPAWMRRLGLEWLFRLGQEPWRWKRQTRLLKFMQLALKELASC